MLWWIVLGWVVAVALFVAFSEGYFFGRRWVDRKSGKW